MNSVKVTITAVVQFDDRRVRRLDTDEISDALAYALSECSQIEDEASVEVTSVTCEPTADTAPRERYSGNFS